MEYIPKPTTMQLPAYGQDTPVCAAPMSPGRAAPFPGRPGLAVPRLDHRHGRAPTDTPVATQRAGDAHETALRPLIAKPLPDADCAFATSSDEATFASRSAPAEVFAMDDLDASYRAIAY
jgi:hypothetical protein